MTGLLWTRLQRGEVEAPAPSTEALARRDLGTRALHGRLWRAIPDITSRLAGIGVDVAVMKGVPAEHRWYDRVGERPCVDLDLLVHPAQVARVNEIIALLQPTHALRDSFESMFAAGLSQGVNLVVDDIAVDLHVDLFKMGPACHHPERLWDHTVALAFPATGEVRVLDAELSLVHFLVHLNRDSFSWLLGFADIARILERETIDWDAVERLVADEAIEVPVWSGLAAVAETLGLPAPGRSARGWRSGLWSVVWRPSVRLQGDAGWVRHRYRPAWLPLVGGSGVPRALRWTWVQLASSQDMVAYLNPGRRGPWWWRLVRGRLGRLASRRRAVSRLRGGQARPFLTSRAPKPTPGPQP